MKNTMTRNAEDAPKAGEGTCLVHECKREGHLGFISNQITGHLEKEDSGRKRWAPKFTQVPFP